MLPTLANVGLVVFAGLLGPRYECGQAAGAAAGCAPSCHADPVPLVPFEIGVRNNRQCRRYVERVGLWLAGFMGGVIGLTDVVATGGHGFAKPLQRIAQVDLRIVIQCEDACEPWLTLAVPGPGPAQRVYERDSTAICAGKLLR